MTPDEIAYTPTPEESAARAAAAAAVPELAAPPAPSSSALAAPPGGAPAAASAAPPGPGAARLIVGMVETPMVMLLRNHGRRVGLNISPARLKFTEEEHEFLDPAAEAVLPYMGDVLKFGKEIAFLLFGLAVWSAFSARKFEIEALAKRPEGADKKLPAAGGTRDGLKDPPYNPDEFGRA